MRLGDGNGLDFVPVIRESREGARIIMETILKTDPNLTRDESRFIRRFLDQRLK